jgi:hypothetical protein
METSREVNEVSEQKIEQFWRDATADDARGALGGKEISARYRKTDSDEWIEGCLYGAIAPGGTVGWYCYNGHSDDFFRQCQVYDPPEIHKNKPDPGEGFRLLEKFPPEPKLGTDEVWRLFKTWETTANDNGVQEEDCWYRRRIANSPTSSDSCRSRDNIPSGWRLLGKDEERLASDLYWSQGCKEWLLIGDHRVEYANGKTGKWHAIRQVVYYDHRELRVNGVYALPGGQTIRITAKGFEVL